MEERVRDVFRRFGEIERISMGPKKWGTCYVTFTKVCINLFLHRTCYVTFTKVGRNDE